ncbi:T9SS type A sorting domain-containing protein [Flavobacterium sp. IMCC34852]|uniref:T9SS type A sorting domain-containing protein n=1 Tax=Flavobacterium rivulicola TaxID=2732161 RepID=A0A7Y3R7N6_9FLAO|nr:T9SS type A sorting domain-containing protein [Flavobacterium sp. IMCC34852]NNT71444.1 T9SS type A sorting domain-containing protein [Flavobacterium sp. IMCC34852]
MKAIHQVVVIFLMMTLSQVGFSQPFQIGHTTINFTDASRNNRVIATEVYYPADVSGDNVSMTTVSGTFPVLSFGHGFVMTWDAYQNVWNALVPNGYIMVFPKTEGSLSPSHLEFGKDLAFVLDQMTVLNTNVSSVFYNRISTMNAVMGHSMGGGASFLAAQLNSNIKTLVNFAAAETNPSAITAAASISIPSLLFSGANDCVTPPNAHQIPMYNGLAGNCKTLISITGGSHCQMANSNFFCNVGESSCSPQPTISRAVQQTIINTYLLPWLDYQLKGNCSQGNLFDTQIVADNAITFQKNCLQCNGLSVAVSEAESFIKVYPNPAGDYIKIEGKASESYQIKIADSHARIISEKSFMHSTTIETETLAHGIYLYTVLCNGKVIGTGKIIK